MTEQRPLRPRQPARRQPARRRPASKGAASKRAASKGAASKGAASKGAASKGAASKGAASKGAARPARPGPRPVSRPGPRPVSRPGPRPAGGTPSRRPGPQVTRPRASRPRASRPRASLQVRQRRIFYRWLWLVYVPIALLPFILLVAMTGLLPHQAHLPLAVLLVWDAGGIALIVERRRRKITIPVPRTLLLGLACLTVTGLSGSILSWMGIDRLASRGGPGLLEVGGFLLLLTVFVPALKLVDLTARSAWRLVLTARARRA
jgi:hypothetical protein